jgi:hypothetical protein
MTPLKLPAFFQGCLVIGIESREHLGFRSSSYNDHVVLARVSPLVDAESHVFPRWLIYHEVAPSPALGQERRLQKLDRRHWVPRLLAGNLFPSLDGAVHVDDCLKDVFLLAPCIENRPSLRSALQSLPPESWPRSREILLMWRQSPTLFRMRGESWTESSRKIGGAARRQQTVCSAVFLEVKTTN